MNKKKKKFKNRYIVKRLYKKTIIYINKNIINYMMLLIEYVSISSGLKHIIHVF